MGSFAARRRKRSFSASPMNTLVSPSFRRACAASFLVLSALSLTARSAAADPAAERLARHGSVTIMNAGPFVEPGTFRVQVAAKLGRPDLALADGTWAYRHRRVEQSAAEGTLLVRFSEEGRVAGLQLVTPAVFAALRASPRAAAPDLLAKN